MGRPGLVLHGGTPVRARRQLVERFQKDERVPFFVLSLKAGGTGLNLTAASHVVHFDRWWNPAVEDQATDRAFRIGQTRNVLVHKFVCRGTVEERIDELIASKRGLAKDVLEGGAELLLTEMTDEDLLRLVALDAHAALKDELMVFRRRKRAAQRTRWADDFGFGPYVSSAENRQARSGRQLRPAEGRPRPVARLRSRAGRSPPPSGARRGARTSSATPTTSNRLPRGRSYLRQGSVDRPADRAGRGGGARQRHRPLLGRDPRDAREADAWQAICRTCAGEIDSVVELLQGRLSDRVMGHLCRQDAGLFPTPREIRFSCTCPDAASMCKHVAASLYGVGARLDEQPELLFRLRDVDEQELLARAASGIPLSAKAPPAGRVLDAGLLEELFGVEIEPARRAEDESG